MTRSGSINPLSGATHHQKSNPLAKEQATPEYQYRSQIMFLPSLRMRSISFMASHRLALNSKWMASLPISVLLRRKSLIIDPMADFRLGKLITTALFSFLSPEHFSSRNLVILDLPHLSSPSSTMNLPFIALQLYRQIIFEMRINGHCSLVQQNVMAQIQHNQFNYSLIELLKTHKKSIIKIKQVVEISIIKSHLDSSAPKIVFELMIIYFFSNVVPTQNLLVLQFLPEVHAFEYLLPVYYLLQIYVDRVKVIFEFKTKGSCSGFQA